MTSSSLPRRSVLALGAAALLTGCGSNPAGSKPSPGGPRAAPRPQRIGYGPGPQQFGELTRPHGASRGTVVVIHGGFWLAEYDLSLGRPISADLASRGWTTWNLEYRRLGDGGGWPTTFEDVAAGIDRLASIEGLHLGKVVALGHSAGGQLAVWSASRSSKTPGGRSAVPISAVVSQAGVLDLRTAAAENLGGPVVEGLLGGTPAARPDRYRAVDPIERLPLGVPVRCVHGRADVTVPLEQSSAYVTAARKAGDDATLIQVPGDHFALIEPTTPAWRTIRSTLDSLVPASPSTP